MILVAAPAIDRLLIQARRLTDLNWFAQVSRVKVLYTKRNQSVVASIHYYNNVALFCSKIFEVDGITCNNNHTITVAETGH